MKTSRQLIDTQKGVDEVCARLTRADAVGVDTEFLRVRTYFPRLALIQLAAGETVYCVDPLAPGLRLDPLWRILGESDALKVMHAARQDIEVLLHTAGVMPAPLFDTQVAAGLVGYNEQVGYAGLVEAEFGETLPKTSQRTDWTRRPLSDAQLGYAENDVRYLLPLHDCLGDRLRDLGRCGWAEEDFQLLLDPGLYRPDPEQAYQRVGRGAHLPPGAQHDLRRLCAWRERTAQQRDLPRGWVMSDETLVAVAAARPRSLEDLAGFEGVSTKAVRRDGRSLLACFQADSAPPSPLWRRRVPLSDQEKAAKRALVKALETEAARLSLTGSVLATRADLERIARGAAPGEVMRGWRREAIEQPLQDALAGLHSSPAAVELRSP